MVISTGLFIDGRVGQLDLIRAGWLFMHRTMTEQDQMRFEQMINTPGFCVKKFEEMFLLRRINPFAPSEEQRIMMFDHSDCACKNAQDAREISEMKNQLGDFIVRWENVFKQLPPNLSALASFDSLNTIDDLQQQTAQKLNTVEKNETIEKDGVAKKSIEKHETKENGSKERDEIEDKVLTDKKKNNGSSNEDGVQENNIKVGESVQNNDQKSDMKNSGDIEVVSKTNNTSNLQHRDTEKQNACKKDIKKNMIQDKPAKEIISTTEKEAKNEKSKDAPKNLSSESSQETLTNHHHGNAVAEQCVWNVAHVSGKPNQPKLQYSQAAASGVTKPVEKQTSPSSVPKQPLTIQKFTQPESPKETTSAQHVEPTQPFTSHVEKEITVACTEDKVVPMSICTDISPAITDNSRSAGTPDSGMISDISEVKISQPELDVDEKETSKSKDPEKMTGRDGRRYRQKLREAEKAALAQVVKEEDVEDVTQEDTKQESVESEVVISENTAPTGKEKRRQKDKLRREKKEQERLLKQSEPAEPVASATDAANENCIVPNASQEAAKTDVTSEEPTASAEEIAIDQFEQTADETPEQAAAEDDDAQVKKLSKSQKKRAQKKAAKGVYVVNDNRSHSIELLPGEYKIVQLDKDRNIQEIEFVNGEEKEVNEGESDEKKKEGVFVRPMKKSVKNLLVAGNLSKDILDNGKWLAYVIDDKDPNGEPKFGEVSTIDVEKTIKMLDSKQATKKALQQDGYVDDVDYTCTKNPGHISTTIKQILPEMDADVVRENFAKLIECSDPGCYAGPTEEEIATQPEISDLQIMIDQAPGFKFHTELAKRTSPLLVGNDEFREFCIKYSKSKYDNGVISSLIKKYIDTRIIYHYERFKKLADREARRIAKCWTKVTDCSPFALMLMLYINNPKSNVQFGDIEAVLFPSP